MAPNIGRRGEDGSGWGEWAELAESEAMRRIAVRVRRMNVSLLRFARDFIHLNRSVVVRHMESAAPRPTTIMAYAKALKLPKIAVRALIDEGDYEITDIDVSGVEREVMISGLLNGSLDGFDETTRREAARVFILAQHGLDEEDDRFAAYIATLGTDLVTQRLAERREKYSKRVLDAFHDIRQRVPAASNFSLVDEKLLLDVLERHMDFPYSDASEPNTVNLSAADRKKMNDLALGSKPNPAPASQKGKGGRR